MTAIGKPASATVGKTQYCGPFQPPVGNQPKPILKTTISRIARTKLGVAMPMIEIEVES
jgi:hypothetical protein